MKNRLYTSVGISTDPKKGITKLRLTNDSVTQTKRYKRNGHTNVVFYDLPSPRTKLDAAKYVLDPNALFTSEFTDAAFCVINRALPNGTV